MDQYIAAIDQGTTSSRCIVFNHDGGIVSAAQREHRQSYPRPGWVEHDAEEIWNNVSAVLREALGDRRPVALGITNQRETTLVWDRHTGRAVHPAIVWQDTRTASLVQELDVDWFRERTGLPPSTYFSGPKLRWLLDRMPDKNLLFGTMDSWLIWKLTGRHVTDVTNASRTMLMNLRTLDWDPEILALLDIPRSMLPDIVSSSEVYGDVDGIPVASALGDQQAALVGQACFAPGGLKSTYGTGAFLLLHTGDAPVASRHGLLSTVAYRFGDTPAQYALEGSIAVAGSLVQWFRDNLGLIGSAAEIEVLASTVDDSGGCYLVPAFSGLFAPHWRPDARGVVAGLTGYVTKAHLARAVLEATAWQTREVVDAMRFDIGAAAGLTELRVDGGMTANGLLLQTLADVLDVPVVRPRIAETTCLGAAYAAGLAVGYWPDLDTVRDHWREDARWTPTMDPAARDRAYAQWRKAVARTLDWLDPSAL